MPVSALDIEHPEQNDRPLTAAMLTRQLGVDARYAARVRACALCLSSAFAAPIGWPLVLQPVACQESCTA